MLSNVTFVLLVSFNCQIYCIKSLEPKFFTSYYSYKSNSFSPQERYSNKRMLNVSVLSFFICLHALGSLTAVVDSLMELDLMLRDNECKSTSCGPVLKCQEVYNWQRTEWSAERNIVVADVGYLSSRSNLWLLSCNNSFTGKSAEPNMYI